MLEKIYEEPELIIENVLFYEQYPNKKPKNRKKNRFTKIKIVKNKDGILELLGNSVLSIINENNFFIPKIYHRAPFHAAKRLGRFFGAGDRHILQPALRV